jgi:hypothetical protein
MARQPRLIVMARRCGSATASAREASGLIVSDPPATRNCHGCVLCGDGASVA